LNYLLHVTQFSSKWQLAPFYKTGAICEQLLDKRRGIQVKCCKDDYFAASWGYTGHTQKNGAVLIVNTIKTAPLFCVCPVYVLLVYIYCRFCK
jgi:hypothetical protein